MGYCDMILSRPEQLVKRLGPVQHLLQSWQYTWRCFPCCPGLHAAQADGGAQPARPAAHFGPGRPAGGCQPSLGRAHVVSSERIGTSQCVGCADFISGGIEVREMQSRALNSFVGLRAIDIDWYGCFYRQRCESPKSVFPVKRLGTNDICNSVLSPPMKLWFHFLILRFVRASL